MKKLKGNPKKNLISLKTRVQLIKEHPVVEIAGLVVLIRESTTQIAGLVTIVKHLFHLS